MKWWVDENIRETPTEVQQVAFLCTKCGKAFGGTGLAHIMEKFVYCPYCGIKLEGEEISNIAKKSADKIAEALEKVKAKGWQKQNIEEDDKE